MANFSVHEIQAKSVINRVKGMPFDWSINPYRGCRHACVYCYARPTHEYLGLNSADEFQEVIFAKVNAAEIVDRELTRRSWRGENVVIGTATDPYQQAESKYQITRSILQQFLRTSNPVSVTTKSPMILRDLDILGALARVADVCVAVTITTMDESIWRKVEPTTSRPTKRLETIAKLREAGIRAGVLLSPILPGLTDAAGHLDEVVSAAAEYNADFLSAGVLRLGPGISEYYLPFVEKEFPRLVNEYRELFRGNYAPGFYRQTIQRRVDDLCIKYGVEGTRNISPLKRGSTRPRQMDLFAAAA